MALEASAVIKDEVLMSASMGMVYQDIPILPDVETPSAFVEYTEQQWIQTKTQ